jgi:hypothetical protein
VTGLELCVVIASLATALASLLLVVGLAGRLRALERIARQRKVPPQLPQPGHLVQPFEVESTTGDKVSAASLAAYEHALVCFVTSGCSKCTALEERLVARPPQLPVVSFIYGDLAEAHVLAARLGELGPVAIFESHRVAEAFGAASFPTLVRLERGVVAAAGRTLEDVVSR